MQPRNVAEGRWEAASTCSVTMPWGHLEPPWGSQGTQQVTSSPCCSHRTLPIPLPKGLLDNTRLAKGRATEVTTSFACPCHPRVPPCLRCSSHQTANTAMSITMNSHHTNGRWSGMSNGNKQSRDRAGAGSCCRAACWSPQDVGKMGWL